jgi:hypothetical protein
MIRYGAILASVVFLFSFIGGLSFAKELDDEFWSNFFLNIAAEMLGLALTAWAVYFVARQKFGDLMPPVIKLIAQLRSDNKITPQVARSGVVCAVAIIPDERLRRTDPPLSILRQEEQCQVCSLTAQTDLGDGGFRKCHYCGLQSDRWRNPSE